MMRSRWPVLAGLGAVLCVWAVVWTMLLLGPVLNLELGDRTTGGNTRLSIGIFLFGNIQGVILLAALVAVGINDHMRHKRISALLWPIALEAACMLAVTTLASIQTLYAIHHDFQRTYEPAREPEVRLFANFLYVGVFGALGWFLTLLLRGRGTPTWMMAGLFFGISLAGAALLIAAVW